MKLSSNEMEKLHKYFSVLNTVDKNKLLIKCENDCEVFATIRKINNYNKADILFALCNCYKNKIRKWTNIKSKIKNSDLELKSLKADFLRTGDFSVVCSKKHLTNNKTFCQKCVSNNTEIFNVIKRCSDKYTNNSFLYKDKFMLMLRKQNNQCLQEAFKHLMTLNVDKNVKVLVRFTDFKRINLIKLFFVLDIVYSTTSEGLIFELFPQKKSDNIDVAEVPTNSELFSQKKSDNIDVAEIPTNSELQIDVAEVPTNSELFSQKKSDNIDVAEIPTNSELFSQKKSDNIDVAEILTNSEIQDDVGEIPTNSELFSQKKSDNIDVAEILTNSVYQMHDNVDSESIEEEVNSDVNIDFKVYKNEFLQLICKKQQILHKNYSNVEDKFIISDEKFAALKQLSFKTSQKQKNQKPNIVLKEESGEGFIDFYQNPKTNCVYHNFYLYLKKCDTNIDISEEKRSQIRLEFTRLTEILKPENIHGFLNERVEFNEIFNESVSVKINMDCENFSIENFSDVIETTSEKSFATKYVSILKAVRADIVHFQNFNCMQNKSSFLKNIKKLHDFKKKDFCLTDIFIYDFLKTEECYSDFRIDPSVIVTIIFAASDANKSPFAKYFRDECPVYRHSFEDDINNIFYVKHKDVTKICSYKYLLKKLYFDSGVAELFWKLIVYLVDITKNNFEEKQVKFKELISCCPKEMFDTDMYQYNNLGKVVFEADILTHETISCDFSIVSFLSATVNNICSKKCYTKRALISRLIYLIMINDLRVIHLLEKSTVFGFMYYLYNCRQDEILNETEIFILKKKPRYIQSLLIKSEITNMFNNMILNEKDVKLDGTILHPNIKY